MQAQVACEDCEEGRAMISFLSPMDAILEAAYNSKPPSQIYQVLPIEQFDPRELIEYNSEQLIIFYHYGYAASVIPPQNQLIFK
ncbi:hypothetical protein ACFQNF_06330 [Iodobacter arcticus]|uniref:Uncharacterized protein n=1 Tax=Iodobacter arcticus TaxID=590593 RepID=A0ABW2QUT9_9NEIS